MEISFKQVFNDDTSQRFQDRLALASSGSFFFFCMDMCFVLQIYFAFCFTYGHYDLIDFT